MDVCTNVSWSEIVDRERPGVEDEDDMHAQTVTVELHALLWILDTYHHMVELVCVCPPRMALVDNSRWKTP